MPRGLRKAYRRGEFGRDLLSFRKYGKTPDQVVQERLRVRRKLAHAKADLLEGRAGPDDIARACLIVEVAKEVS